MTIRHSPRSPIALRILPSLLALALLGGCATAPPTTSIPPGDHLSTSEPDSFYSLGRSFHLTVALDSLALLTRDSIAISEIDLGVPVRLVRVDPGGLYIYALAQPQERRLLVDLARRLRELPPSPSQAGLIARPEGSSRPFIVTDLFVARFQREVPEEEIERLHRQWGVRVVSQDRLVPNEFLLSVTEASPADALTVANRYFESPLTEFAHPDFIRAVDPRDTIPNDPLFSELWHLHNTGQGGGTADADIDAPGAWDFTMGDPKIVIAVLDGGFDMQHPDLKSNWRKNGAEIVNGVDDDGNDYVDDINGWDFVNCAYQPGWTSCGDSDPSGVSVVPCSTSDWGYCKWVDGSHGTLTAGAAAAIGNNARGVTGACPSCSILPIRIPWHHDEDSVKRAIQYARGEGARVLSNSWGDLLVTDQRRAALEDASVGAAIVFAMTNESVDNCSGSTAEFDSLEFVMAVSRSTNKDRRVGSSGFGDCMDLLAPSAGLKMIIPDEGTLFASSTDLQAAGGLNSDYADPACIPDLNDRDYTRCFAGTSFSTPLVAGVAGLIFSADPSLSPLQVQRLLQDTADRIEDSSARYDSGNGFSRPSPDPSTHGYGRINAFEAVRVVASPTVAGKGGVDAFLRDNRLDWGNTEQPSNTTFEPTRGFIGHWASPDIKVDAPPFHPDLVDSKSFEAWADENPEPGAVNRVYVRIRNRGPGALGSATVKLHFARFGTVLPLLPADFWTVWPNNSIDTSGWQPARCTLAASPGPAACTIGGLGYSGSSVAGTSTDAAQVVRFEASVPADAKHLCFLAIVDSPQDRVLPKTRPTTGTDFVVDWLTPNDNNVAHRNYADLVSTGLATFVFAVRNPLDTTSQVRIRLEGPGSWRITDQRGGAVSFPLTLKPGTEVPLVLMGSPQGSSGEFQVIQEARGESGAAISGGFTVRWDEDEMKKVE